MSVMRNIRLNCPACSGELQFEAAHSVNADRRPDLRDAIIGETFQSQDCLHCGETFRLAPELNYLDLGRGQWIGAHAVDELGRWKEIEDRDRELFNRAFGAAAPKAARAIGANLTPRITFGWPAMREKVILPELRLDDLTVELVKIAILRAMEESPLDQDTELRLVDADSDTLHMVWFQVPSEEVVDSFQVPRALYDEVTADVDGWAAIRSQFENALFVDMNRMLIPEEAESAPSTPVV